MTSGTYLLDSTVFSSLMAQRPRVVARVAEATGACQLRICTVVRGEILFGIEKLPKGHRRQEIERAAADTFAYIPCESIPEAAADIYARIKWDAQMNGTAIGENDLWIAATAMAMEATVASSDKDFQRIRGLRVEDWLSEGPIEPQG